MSRPKCCTLVGVTVRKVGVEEELLLVDPATGRPAEVSNEALSAHHAEAAAAAELADADHEEGPTKRPHDIEQELFLQQIETASARCMRRSGAADAQRERRRGLPMRRPWLPGRRCSPNENSR